MSVSSNTSGQTTFPSSPIALILIALFPTVLTLMVLAVAVGWFGFLWLVTSKSAVAVGLLVIYVLYAVYIVLISRLYIANGIKLGLGLNPIKFMWLSLPLPTISILLALAVISGHQDFWANYVNNAGGPATAICTLIVWCILAPVVEEITFRGWLWAGLSRVWPTWKVALCTALVCYASHFPHSVTVATGLIIPSICVTATRWICGSTRATIPTHAALNFLVLAVANFQ